MISTRSVARLSGLIALLAMISISVLGQSPCLTEVTGRVVSFDEAFGSVATDITAQALQEAGISVGDLVELRMSGYVLEVPVISELFPQLPQSLPGVILWGNAYIGGWYRNIAAEYNVALGDEILIRLAQKEGYLDEIAAREVDHVESRDECISDEAYANFREVSCGNIAASVLFRSSHPADGSVKSGYAHALMVQAGVQTIINVGASRNEPQQAFGHSEYYRALGDEGAVLATNIGLAVTWPHFKAELARALRFMIDHAPPYLIHCSLGQDRAGITSAVLQAVTGADLQDVIDDYALTFDNYYRITPGHPLYPEVVEQLVSKLREMNNGDAVTAENLQDVIARYLIDEVGLSDSEVYLLQEKLSGESRDGAPSEPELAEDSATSAGVIDAVPQGQRLEEVDGRLVLDDFDDGDLTSELRNNWRSYLGDGGSLASPIRVEQSSDGAPSVLSVGAHVGGVEIAEEWAYVVDWKTRDLFKVETRNGEFVRFDCGLHGVNDLASDGTLLWIVAEDGTVATFDLKDETFSAVSLGVDLDGEVHGVAYERALYLLVYRSDGPAILEIHENSSYEWFGVRLPSGIGELIGLQCVGEDSAADLVTLDYISGTLYRMTQRDLTFDLSEVWSVWDFVQTGSPRADDIRGFFIQDHWVWFTRLGDTGELHRVPLEPGSPIVDAGMSLGDGGPESDLPLSQSAETSEEEID